VVAPLVEQIHLVSETPGIVVFTCTSRRLAIVCCEEAAEEACAWARRLASAGLTVVLLYSHGRPDQIEQVREAGAVECWPLGFSLSALSTRLQALTTTERHLTTQDGRMVRLTDCGLMIGSRVFRLTPAEYRIVQALWEAAGQIVSYVRLEQALYQGSGPCERQAVRQAIYRLRIRLGPYNQLVETVPGFGYRLRTDLLSSRDDPVMAS